MFKLVICLLRVILILNKFESLTGLQNSSSSMCIYPNKSNKSKEFYKLISKGLLPFNVNLLQKNYNKLNENQGHIETLLKEIRNEKETQQNVTKVLQAMILKLIPQDLHHRLAKIDHRQQLLQNSMKIQNKMILNNKEIQLKMNQKLINKQLETIKKQIPQEIEQSLKVSHRNIQFQLLKLQRILSKIETRQRFQSIGLKLYYIEDNIKQNWTIASQFCRKMGGSLATPQNNEEFQAIKGKINPDHVYWLGINDHHRKGEFISVASGNRVTYFKWLPGEPLYDDDSQRYVNLFNGGMRVENGSINRNFICQYYED
ncbi:hypothetical protein KR059_005141 [Drosophila kikkawai]|nr:hypothetical protein KR059_005141 [Drosophila kikkawai]